MTQTRRNALATIAAMSTLSLAGCTSQIPGSQSSDNPEDNTGNNDNNSTEEESSNELSVQTGGFTADNFETIRFTGEVTGLGDHKSVEAGIQIKSFYADDWFPEGRRQTIEFENLAQPREYTWEVERTVWGGGEYQYRAVVNTGSREEPLHGETKTLTLQDLPIKTPEIEFRSPSLDTSNPAVVEIPVENVSEVNSGEVRGDVQWFDSNETFLGESYGRVHFLRGREKGVLRVSSYADGVTQDSIEDFEYSTRYFPVFEPMEGMNAVNSSMSLETPRRNITGTATNELSDPPSYVDAVARFLDTDGRVIGNINDRQTVRDVPKGSNWEFEVRISREYVDVARAADEFEVVLLEG
jgi:hypothetical protein